MHIIDSNPVQPSSLTRPPRQHAESPSDSFEEKFRIVRAIRDGLPSSALDAPWLSDRSWRLAAESSPEVLVDNILILGWEKRRMFSWGRFSKCGDQSVQAWRLWGLEHLQGCSGSRSVRCILSGFSRFLESAHALTVQCSLDGPPAHDRASHWTPCTLLRV